MTTKEIREEVTKVRVYGRTLTKWLGNRETGDRVRVELSEKGWTRAEIEANLGNPGRARLAADCADHAYAFLEGIAWVLQAAGYDYDLHEETNNTKIFKEA